MNIIRNVTKCRNYSTTIHKVFLEHLTSRSLIRVDGAESLTFLQGLITNDMTHLSRHARGIYAMFLNKPGRILFDSIIYKTPSKENIFLVECDRTMADKLVKHLRMFRVRKKINIDLVDGEHKVWSAFQRDSVEIPFVLKTGANDNVIVCLDPRLKLLGLRLITPHSFCSEEVGQSLDGIEIVPNSGLDYRMKRYELGICEGVDEMLPEKSFALESNCDYMHGVSFHKGCYLGQEFTARTHHTGVVRKRIMPVRLETGNVDMAGDLHVKNEADKSMGLLRGLQGDKGIGLIRVDDALASKQLMVQGVICRVERPFWWPKEMPAPEKLSNC